ncbi:DUF2889 domain-containing protein [Mycolicibacterium pulveris]|uniref:DUF2889 domain-containing protein n=1 Tax=Mycolicibacterium pulveris TaxID=36813 RepID=A0A7I7UI54_MYCPV|nr:DUF2889 domain-containing protein [Mycolicibacterium pulveris]MCV6980904.1 DUF2889 domain-containing protein [Mycolicibacterium pulveris]BBY80511.1 hypothetical protein MPUL_16690 [Mycolicibacterium pulveris]
MPFVSDIAGPQQPVESSPPLVTGALRRTSTIDTHPAGDDDSVVDLRASDVVGRGSAAARVLGRLAIRAHLANRVVDDISAVPHDDRLSRLVGHRVGPGFRSAVGERLPDEVRRASLLHLLLDDWVGAALVSGYALQRRAVDLGTEQKLPDGTADRMGGICAGFAPDASMVSFARRHNMIPTARGPVAPPLDLSAHPVEPLRANGMRRYRRLDLRQGADNGSADFDAHFRDSHMDRDGVETVLHEYTVVGSVDTSTRRIASISADVRVLPWQECPGAIASARRAQDMTVAELRSRVRSEFVGTSTCTHLNDTLRALGDLDALFELLRAR